MSDSNNTNNSKVNINIDEQEQKKQELREEEEQAKNRPDWLPEKFKDVDSFVNSYKELEKKLHNPDDKKEDDNDNESDNNDNDKKDNDNDNNDNDDAFNDLETKNDNDNENENTDTEEIDYDDVFGDLKSNEDDDIEKFNNITSEFGKIFNEEELGELIEEVSNGTISKEYRDRITENYTDKKELKAKVDQLKELGETTKNVQTKLVDTMVDAVGSEEELDVLNKYFDVETNENNPIYKESLEDFREAFNKRDLKMIKITLQNLKNTYEKYNGSLNRQTPVKSKRSNTSQNINNEHSNNKFFRSNDEYNQALQNWLRNGKNPQEKQEIDQILINSFKKGYMR